MKTKFIQNYTLALKKELATFLACNKFATTKVYYKSEIYACSTLKMPVVAFTLSSRGEVVLKQAVLFSSSSRFYHHNRMQ
nr:hypothetical protein LKV13_04525 [Borrelia sp. BU AG58]